MEVELVFIHENVWLKFYAWCLRLSTTEHEKGPLSIGRGLRCNFPSQLWRFWIDQTCLWSAFRGLQWWNRYAGIPDRRRAAHWWFRETADVTNSIKEGQQQREVAFWIAFLAAVWCFWQVPKAKKIKKKQVKSKLTSGVVLYACLKGKTLWLIFLKLRN